MAKNGLNITPSIKTTALVMLTASRTKSTLMAQSKQALMSMKISCPTRVVFTSTLPEPSKVVTLSRLLAMVKKTEPTIGSVLTHGTPTGVKMVSSELLKVTQTLTLTSGSVNTPANLNSTNDDSGLIKT